MTTLLNTNQRFDLVSEGSQPFNLSVITENKPSFLFNISVSNTFALGQPGENTRVCFQIQNSSDEVLGTSADLVLGAATRTNISSSIMVSQNLCDMPLRLVLIDRGPLNWCNGQDDINITVQAWGIG